MENKFNIGDKVSYKSLNGQVKDIKITIEYLVDLGDGNRSEWINEKQLCRYSNAIPTYIKQIISIYKNLNNCDKLFYNGSEIVLTNNSQEKFRIPVIGIVDLKTWKDYSLEDFGL